MTQREVQSEKNIWKQIIALVVSVSLFALVTFGVTSGDSFSTIDGEINAYFASLTNPFLTSFFTIITHTGSAVIMLVLAAVMVWYLCGKKRINDALLVASSMTVGPALGYAIKHIAARPRPELQLIIEDGFSFPSGHALVATIFFSLLVYLFVREFKSSSSRALFVSVNLIMIVLIGISRLYLEVHWFSDVIGSFSLGFAVVLVMIVLNPMLTSITTYFLSPFLPFPHKK